jgi:N-acyl-D-amino-acid deacylase
MNDPLRFDLILAGGLVVDGTGKSGFLADVGIIDDCIARIGDLSQHSAARRIDCRHKVVAPGFVDTHTHDDTALMLWPELPQKTSQGVTSVVIGNCGISIAPSSLPGAPPAPLDLIGDAEKYRFATMGEYLDHLDAHPAAVNVVALTGHMSLRASVMHTLNRPADVGETKAMQRMLSRSLEDGSIGFSTGLAYAPSSSARLAEVVALAHLAGEADGIHCTHMRDEGDYIVPAIREACEIGRRANIPTLISHHKLLGKANHGRSLETLAIIEEAREVQALAIDAYPYVASSTVLKLDRVRQSTSVLITWSTPIPEASGRDLAEIARNLGCEIEEAVERLSPAGAIYFVLDEADVSRILAWPETMIGSDGIPQDSFPHPRLWGTFARVLGQYVRETGLLTLEAAVRKMTALPAEVFGLVGRGKIEPGAYADIVVFDSATILDQATFLTPTLPARGIELVLVNGRDVFAGQSTTGARPGRVLRRAALNPPMSMQRHKLRKHVAQTRTRSTL